jgi:GTPase SAR1 family protein
VTRWLKELREHADQNIVIMLVGNKKVPYATYVLLTGTERVRK